jgi:hypothetical protein
MKLFCRKGDHYKCKKKLYHTLLNNLALTIPISILLILILIFYFYTFNLTTNLG